MPYLLLLSSLGTRTVMAITTKSNSRSYSALGMIGSFLYVFVTAVFSVFFFWALNGFTLSINPRVTLYGAIYAGVVIVNLTATVFMYNYGSITTVSFIQSTLSLILAALSGALLFGEQFPPEKLLQIAIMLLCVSVVFIGARKTIVDHAQQKQRSGLHPLSIILPSIVALMGVVATMFMKTYDEDVGTTDINSFFFMTNVFLLIYTVPIILAIGKKRGIPLGEIGSMIADKRTFILFINTAIGSVSSVISAALIAEMEVAVYTAASSAIGFIAPALATPFVRERLDRYSITATLLALLSIIIPSLI